MNDRAAFHAAIRENPDDDVVRLVYADWLEENGEAERAEFIRLEIEADRLPLDDPERERVNARALQMWKEHSTEWFGPLAREPEDWETERGMLQHLAVSAPDFIEHAAHFIERCEILPSIALMDCGECASALSEFRCLGRFSDVYLDIYEEDLAEVILMNPHLGSIERLDLCNAHIDFGGMVKLVENTSLTRLQTLWMEDARLPTEAGELLASAPWANQLRELRLAGNPINDLGWRDLFRGDFSQLRNLIAYDTGFGESGAIALAESETVNSLLELDIYRTLISDDGCTVLASSRNVLNLRNLRIGGREMSTHGWSEIVHSPMLNEIDHLAVVVDRESNRFGSVGEVLARSAGLPKLKHLQISSAILNASNVEWLGRWPGISRLRSLALRYSPLGSSGFVRFIESIPELPDLESLQLRWCALGDDAMYALANCEKLPNLNRLELPQNYITDLGASALLGSPYYTKVKSLDISFNPSPSDQNVRLSEGVRTALKARFGGYS